MAMQYFNQLRAKRRFSWGKGPDPVLSEEDEAFLRRVTTQGDVVPLSDSVVKQEANNQPEGKDAQIALMDGAQNIPLPPSPVEETSRELVEDGGIKNEGESTKSPGKEASELAEKAKKNKRWSWMRTSKVLKDSNKVRGFTISLIMGKF